MAEGGEQTPLLENENSSSLPHSNASDIPRERVHCTRNDNEQLIHFNNSDTSSLYSLASPEYVHSSAQKCHDQEVVGMFIVAFDIKEGNMLEWCLPESLPLDGIEFRAMISGAHTIAQDFIYLRHSHYYGVACYEKKTVVSERERGARMKSIGILTHNYEALHQHLGFLAEQVKKLLDNTIDYSILEEYYRAQRATIPPYPEPAGLGMEHTSTSVVLPSHPSTYFPSFFKYFGPSVLLLWKATLLRKRILLCSFPPIGPVCSQVYCLTQLSTCSQPGLQQPMVKPLFYINIADAEMLEEEQCYVACTTEKIFEEKTFMHDVYVDKQVIHLPSATKACLQLTSQDQYRYNNLISLTQDGNTVPADYVYFFRKLNNKIFSTLSQVAQSDNPTVDENHMISMGLDPKLDRKLVTELAETHGFDVVISVKGRSCCCC